MVNMSRLSKREIYLKALELGCINTPRLSHYFKYVFVGFDLKERIDVAKRKANIYW